MLIKLPKEHRQQIISSIQDYFETEFNEELGQLAAENWLDFMLKELTPPIYNQALADARGTVEQLMVSLEEEMYALEKPMPAVNRK